MIERIAGTDDIRISFVIDKEEIVYYYRAFIGVTQQMLRHEMDRRDQDSMSLLLGIMGEMIPEPEQELYHVYDLEKQD
jgi:hypothetical protein